jgi:hypothetical protein
MLDGLQPWLVTTLSNAGMVLPFMRSRWGWPICETAHFVGLSLLVGTIGMFDLRLLGVAKRVPIAALHRLIPWGVAGFIINVITGFLFLATEPVEYIYNPSFHFKMLFMTIAGLNVLVFYLAVFRTLGALEPGAEAPLAAKIVAGTSLFMWTGVMVMGRMLTFTRPGWCGLEAIGFLSTSFLPSCIPLPR